MLDYSQATKTELAEVEEHDKYLLQSRPQIVAVLRDLSKRTPFITAYLSGGKQYLLTTVLAVLPDRDLVVLDYGQDEKVNERALSEGEMLCVTKMDNISIKFRVNELRKARYQGEVVFAAAIPDALHRPQRREFFRVSTPIVNPITCHVDESEIGQLELRVVDISCGGLCLVDENLGHRYTDGGVLRDCRIELGEFGIIEVDLEIRNSFKQTRKDDSEIQRIGCRFLQLNNDINNKLQRYIHKLQLNQRND